MIPVSRSQRCQTVRGRSRDWLYFGKRCGVLARPGSPMIAWRDRRSASGSTCVCGHPVRRVAASCREGLSLCGQSRSGQERSGTERRSSARTPVLALGAALGSHLCVALSSAHAILVVLSPGVSHNTSCIFLTAVQRRDRTAWQSTARRGRMCAAYRQRGVVMGQRKFSISGA